jgi:hypothetical protein
MKRFFCILIACLSAQAASIPLGSPTSTTGTGNNLVAVYTAGAITVEVRAYALVNNAGHFQSAAFQTFNAFGSGVCNQAEASTCTFDDWQVSSAATTVTGSTTNHYRDFLLFTFTSGAVDLVNVILNQTSYTPHDSDFSYWTSTSVVTSLLGGGIPLGFSPRKENLGGNLVAGGSSSQRTALLDGSSVRTLMIAAGSNSVDWNDYFKLLTLNANAIPSSGVPEPSTFALLGSGLAAVAALRRRK